MNLSPQAIMIIAVVFGAGFLMMIPFMVAQSKRKKKAAAFSSANSQRAILHLYADAPVIDGRKIKDMEYIKGENLQYTVALPPGRHTVAAKYATTSIGMGKNINYKTPKPIEAELDLEAGHEYTIAVYLYSAEDRERYYDGDVGEAVYSQALDISGAALGGYAKAYIICYKEK